MAAEAVPRRLQDDCHDFFSRREWYGRMGVPWRRGYLRCGSPGAGKTRVACALAGEVHLELCAMSLSNAKRTDAMLSNQLQSTPLRSLILIEDIDGFFNAREKQDTRTTISFSALLNAPGGVGAQEGCIVVLTTNHRERLAPALIRPGRFGVEIELGSADAQQLQGMLPRFFPEAQAHAARLVADYVDGALSPAQIRKILIAAGTTEEAEVRLRAAPTAEPARPAQTWTPPRWRAAGAGAQGRERPRCRWAPLREPEPRTAVTAVESGKPQAAREPTLPTPVL